MISPCCKAGVMVAWAQMKRAGMQPGPGDSVWYECEKCGKACDPIRDERATPRMDVSGAPDFSDLPSRSSE